MQNSQMSGPLRFAAARSLWADYCGNWVELTRSPRSKAASPFAFRQRARAPGTGLKGDALSVQAQYAPGRSRHPRKSLV